MFVEGYFSVKENASIKFFLSSNELDFDNDLVVRREIASNGKSRAFINDTPVNLTQLKALGRLLRFLHPATWFRRRITLLRWCLLIKTLLLARCSAGKTMCGQAAIW